MSRPLAIAAAIVAILAAPAAAQDYAARHAAALAYLESSADWERQVMIPMRDGVRLSALLLFPKDRPRRDLPAVVFRSPYLIEPGEIQRFSVFLESLVRNGYVPVLQSVRGRYWSEGEYRYLVGSEKDGWDTVDWIAKQPWSNGKVGALGCSSTAEEQHRLNAAGHPAFAASVPIGSGAGIGVVGPYAEMGNFYRGGAVQSFWFPWYYSAGYTHRPEFARDLPRETRIRLARHWNLATDPPASGIDTLIWTLPVNRIMERMQAPPGDVDRFVTWLPNDPRWETVDLGGEAHTYHTPALMINSWYDVSMGPNVALFEHMSGPGASSPDVASKMRMIIAPTTHCTQGEVESEHTIVGARDVGDARFDYVGVVQDWFDHFLKGEANGALDMPTVQAYLMGAGEWRAYDAWPPPAASPVAYYLSSDEGANSLFGDGLLATERPREPGSDLFVYDPLNPTPSLGGSICCFSEEFVGGAFDQSRIEARADVLVYSTPPLREAVEITGPVEVVLYLSSDAKDTDLAVKLLDVDPEGRAWNLDDSIQRVRWRDGYDAPVLMEEGEVYEVRVGPLVTSNRFEPGHRIRIEVSGSNFPRYERNLNTGGNNFDEAAPVVARNRIHFSERHPSRVVLPVVRAGGRSARR